VKNKLPLLLLASSLFVLGLALSFGFVSPMVSGWELKNSLMATYGVSTPQQFTELTGLTLNVPALPDFNVISMQLNAFSILFFVVVSFFGGKIKRQVTKTVLVLLLVVFAAGFLVGVEYSKAATPTYTIEPEGLLPKAYDYIVYVSGSTYYRINGADSTVTSGTDDDTIIQTALNQNKSVIIKAGSYSASVTFKCGRLIIDKGATGVTYSIDSSASGTIEDYNDGEIKHYVSGSLMFRMDMETGQISGLSWLNSTSLKFTDEFWYGTDNRTDTLAYPEQAASYIIFGTDTDNNGVADVVYAKNCTTGQIEFGGPWDAGGVDGANASAVMQAAINALNEGGLILIKNGEYSLSSGLTISVVGIKIWGEGSGTVLKANANITMLTVQGSSSDFTNWVDIRHIKLDGNGVASRGIYTNYVGHSRIEDFWVRDFTEAGFYLDSGSQNIVIEQGAFDGNEYDAYLFAMNTHHITFRNVYMGGKYGAYINGARLLSFDRVATTLCDYGIYIYVGQLIEISGWFEKSTYNGIYIRDVSGVRIHDSIFSTSGHEHIILGAAGYRAKYVTIENCLFGATGDGYDGIKADWKGAYYCRLQNLDFADSGSGVSINFASVESKNNIVQGIASTDSTIVVDNGVNNSYIGMPFENSGTATVANDEWISHGLAGTPTTVTLTPRAITYDGVTFNVAVVARNSTHFQVGAYWTNGTAISDDAIEIDWYAEYNP